MSSSIIKPSEFFDWESLEPRYKMLLDEPLTAENIPAWLEKWSDLEKILAEVWAVAQRSKHENTADEAAEKVYLHLVDNITPHAARYTQALTEKLLAVESYTPLAEHQQFFRRFQTDVKLFREENIPLQQEIAKLISQYETLDGSLMVDWDDTQIAIPHLWSKRHNPDRTIRERAWRKEIEARQTISEELDKHFFEMFKLRHALAKNAGFDDYRSYRWQELKRFDYTPHDSLELIESIEQEVIPVLSSIWEKRKQQMKVESLRPWDVQAPLDSREALQPFTTTQELEDGLEHIFSNLDPTLRKQFASMRNGWLDLESRPGKMSMVGYCQDFPVSKMPYIYYSLTGIHTDVWVMLHEMGHAFHIFAFNDHLIWNQWPSVEFSEVASQAMEFLALPYFEKDKGGFYSTQDTQRAKEEQLMRVLMFFPGAARTEAFQHWLYTHDPQTLSAKQIEAKWLELGHRFYPFINWQGLDQERRKSWHDASTFDNLSYGIAFLGAIQIWQNSLIDPRKALEQYAHALSLGASRSLPELFAAAGAKFAFDRATVHELIGFVNDQFSKSN
jgi:oligoendopeptidase F